jgi:hypothetical protein
VPGGYATSSWAWGERAGGVVLSEGTEKSGRWLESYVGGLSVRR